MFAGKTYVLFLYTYLKDVRLVFAPPASVGNFGGEVDNWEWPRHTGDFSFMRAYTAPMVRARTTHLKTCRTNPSDSFKSPLKALMQAILYSCSATQVARRVTKRRPS